MTVSLKWSIMLWAMFFWKTLRPDFHADVTFTRTAYLKIVAESMYISSWQWPLSEK